MKLTSIARIILNEAPIKSPLQLIRAAISKLGKSANAAEDALLKAIKNEEGNIRPNLTLDDIRDIDSDLVNRATKRAEFIAYRPLITAKFYSGVKKTKIDDVVGRLERKEITPAQSVAELNALGVPPSFQKEVRDLSKKTIGNAPTPKPTSPPSPTPPTPPEELSWTKQFIQGMKLSALDYLKKIPGIKNKMSKIYTKQLEPLGVLKMRFDDIMNRISPKIAKGGEYEISDELKELNDVLSQFSAQKSKQQSLVWSEWKDSLNKDLQDKLPKIEDPKFQEFYKYFESSVSGIIKKEPPTLTYTKMYAAMRMFKPGNKGLWGNLNQFRKRIGNTITHMDPRTYNELGETLEQYGRARGIGKEVGDKLIAITVFWPGLFAVGQTILDYTAGKTNINIWGSDTKYYNENKPILDNLYVDNVLNIFRVAFLNYIDKLTMSKEEFTSLIGWSPALYALGLQFLGGDDKKSTTNDEIENNLKQSKKDVENTLPQLKDTLSKNPDLYERLKKIVPNIDETIKPDNTEKPKAENW